MRLSQRILTLLLLIASSSLFAQENEADILFQVNSTTVSANEFMWLYNKNNPDSELIEIDKYLELYTLLKLKVEEAKELDLHLSDAFHKELSSYRKQLAKGYLSDQNVKEALLKKSYERSTIEILAFHVLIRCAADASPADTLKAWQKAIAVKERIKLGEPFMSVARGASDDPTARDNGGNLGYFTVFQTPITFEDAVYSMKPGNLSDPVRTSDGYHIIKVQDIRPASGKVKVAHIMKATPPGSSELQLKKAKTEIDSIYSLLNSGENFARLAHDFSDDKGSAPNAGELPWFGVGAMVNEFSDTSFSLLRNGDISNPFRTMYGWHIVKRLDKEAPLSYKENRTVLESKLSQSYLESLSKKSFVDGLKAEYSYNVNKKQLEWFYSIADSTFRSGNYDWYNKNIPEGFIISYASRKISNKEFCDYISIMGKRAFTNDSIKYINTLIDLKSYDELVVYENSQLEQKYSEFAYLMNEFFDGILLFEITDLRIWAHLKGESEGLQEYWESRKEEFKTPRSTKANIYTIGTNLGRKKSGRMAKEIKKAIKAGSNSDQILIIGNNANKKNISMLSSQYAEGDNSIIDNVKRNVGIHTFTNNKGTHIVEITSITEPEIISYEEALPLIIADYQKLIEKEWYQQLREKFDVRINNSLLEQLKAKYR